MNIYRKTYELYKGPIPKDDEGRTYEIHHIDGNRDNNDIFNLVALSIQDHYDIHYLQREYGACLLISRKMNLTAEEMREGQSFCGKIAAKKAKETGTYNLSPELTSKTQKRIVKAGTHHFQKKNRTIKTCPKCKKTMFSSHYKKYKHGEDCRPKYILIDPNGKQYSIFSRSDVKDYGLDRGIMRHSLVVSKAPIKRGKNKGWQLIMAS
jgi:hypothetical protein